VAVTGARRRLPLEAARGCAGDEPSPRDAAKGVKIDRERPQRRSARLAGVPRAPDRGARLARGRRRGLASPIRCYAVGWPGAASARPIFFADEHRRFPESVDAVWRCSIGTTTSPTAASRPACSWR
jgi:hypothetical protein